MELLFGAAIWIVKGLLVFGVFVLLPTWIISSYLQASSSRMRELKKGQKKYNESVAARAAYKKEQEKNAA